MIMRKKSWQKKRLFELGNLIIVLAIIIQTFLFTCVEVQAKESTTRETGSTYVTGSENDSSKKTRESVSDEQTKESVSKSKKKETTSSSEEQTSTSSTKEKEETSSSAEKEKKEEQKEKSSDPDPKEFKKEPTRKEQDKKSKNDIPFKDAPRYSVMASVVEEVTVGGVVYRCWSDGRAGIVNGNNLPNGVFTVPRTVTGRSGSYAVVHIYNQAFRDNTRITGLRFEANSNLEIIQEYAFFNCTNLSGTLSFANCPKLTVIHKEAFAGSRKVSGIDFGQNSVMRSVGENAFRNCTGVGGKTVVIPDSMRDMGYYAFVNDDNNYKELLHKKIAKLTGSLPSLAAASIPKLPDDAKNYESKVDSSVGNTLLHKAAKWTNEDLTTAEIRIDYGASYDRKANIDLVFVVDNSGSMTHPTPIRDANNVLHNYPRAFMTEDILGDAAKMFLETNKPGYDNRMALVGFGEWNRPIYSTNLLTSSNQVINTLRANPVAQHHMTNYDSGLQGAIDLLQRTKDPDRHQAVIFLSDSAPNDGYGISQANYLRNQGVRVYPIATYFDTPLDTSALRNISYDRNTVYVANDTEVFEKIMVEVLEDVANHAAPLKVKLEDVLSEHFELAEGTQADFTVSTGGGKATSNGKTVTWDLNGCKQGVTHTLKIKVKLKPGTELTASGLLPTNDSLRATDNSITTTEQPKLERYLARFKFENETFPGQPLPEEIMNLLPSIKGGFRNHTNVQADTMPNYVDTKDGQRWQFVGWDANNKVINGTDVLFTGKWKLVSCDWSFIKFDQESRGLANAEFSLYIWNGTGAPNNTELVTTDTIQAGKWRLLDVQTSNDKGKVDFTIPFEKDQYYQLVESRAPDSFRRPEGQWRFRFDSKGLIENNTLLQITGANQELPPKFEVIRNGEFTGLLGVKNEPRKKEMPATGGKGVTTFNKTATVFWLTGLIACGGLVLQYLKNRK